MEQTKICTYREKIKKAARIKEYLGTFTIREVLARVPGFFLAMAMPLPGMAPFGLGFIAQERKLSWRAVLSFLFASLGSFVVCDRLGALKYISAGLIYLGVLFVLEKGIRITDVTSGIVAGTSVFITGLAMLFVQGISVAGVLLLLCEAAIVVSATLMMEKSMQVFVDKSFSPDKLDGETKLSLAAVILIALLSLKEIYIGSLFSVMNLVAVIMLMAVACGCGSGYSTGAGVMLGIVCGIGGDFFMPILGAFSFCGFLSGVLSKFGKAGTAAGVILANGIMAVYTNSAVESVLSLYEVLGSAVLFAFVPKSWIETLGYAIRLGDSDRKSIAALKDGIRTRLNSVADIFKSMAANIERLSEKEPSGSEADVAVLFDCTADKVCAKCRRATFCWGQNFNSTYNEMFALLDVLREKGTIKPEDLNHHFKAHCLNPNGFLEELNHQFDVYRVKQIWRSKLSESRQLVGKQLGGMSEILEKLTEEIDEETKKSAVSAWEIKSRLEICGIKPRDVNIIEDRYGRCKVEILVKLGVCQGKQRRIIEKTVKNMTGCNVLSREEFAENKKLVRLVFTEAERYSVETESATAAAGEKNGDNFRFLHLKNGKFIIAISDGMGTGSRAAKESEAILELLDSFLEAGFDSRIAVKLINSIMIVKSKEDAFVTLDLCIIDLYTGEVKFIKTGAEPSFISNESGRVRTFRAASLPVGLIAEAEAEISKTKVRDGDQIVMITDGVESRESGSLWVSEFIKEEARGSNGGSVADKILNRAVEKLGGTVKDDMTVLSVKIKAAG